MSDSCSHSLRPPGVDCRLPFGRQFPVGIHVLLPRTRQIGRAAPSGKIGSQLRKQTAIPDSDLSASGHYPAANLLGKCHAGEAIAQGRGACHCFGVDGGCIPGHPYNVVPGLLPLKDNCAYTGCPGSSVFPATLKRSLPRKGELFEAGAPGWGPVERHRDGGEVGCAGRVHRGRGHRCVGQGRGDRDQHPADIRPLTPRRRKRWRA